MLSLFFYFIFLQKLYPTNSKVNPVSFISHVVFGASTTLVCPLYHLSRCRKLINNDLNNSLTNISVLKSCTELAKELAQTVNPAPFIKHSVDNLSEYSAVVISLEDREHGNCLATIFVPMSVFKNKLTYTSVYIANQSYAWAKYIDDNTIAVGCLYGKSTVYGVVYGVK